MDSNARLLTIETKHNRSLSHSSNIMPQYGTPPKPRHSELLLGRSASSGSTAESFRSNSSFQKQRPFSHIEPEALPQKMMYHASLNLAIPMSTVYANEAPEEILIEDAQKNSGLPETNAAQPSASVETVADVDSKGKAISPRRRMVSNTEKAFGIKTSRRNSSPGSFSSSVNPTPHTSRNSRDISTHMDVDSDYEQNSSRGDGRRAPRTRKTLIGNLFILCANILTMCISDSFLSKCGRRWNSRQSREAWREKVLTVTIFLILSFCFFIGIEWAGHCFCFPAHDIMVNNFESRLKQKVVVVNGRIIDAHQFDVLSKNIVNITTLDQYSGYDVSSMFPTWTTLERFSKPANLNPFFRCIDDKLIENWVENNIAKENYSETKKSCIDPQKNPVYCMYRWDFNPNDNLKASAIGYQVFGPPMLTKNWCPGCVIVKSKVYNLTRLFTGAYKTGSNELNATTSFLPAAVMGCLKDASETPTRDATLCLKSKLSTNTIEMPQSEANKLVNKPEVALYEHIIVILDSIFFTGIMPEIALDFQPCQRLNPTLLIMCAFFFFPRFFEVFASIVFDSGPGWRYYQKDRSLEKIDEGDVPCTSSDEKARKPEADCSSIRRSCSFKRRSLTDSSPTNVETCMSDLDLNIHSVSESDGVNINIPSKTAPMSLTVNVGSSMPFNMYLVPVYNESVETVRECIESIKKTDYAKDRELLVIVCDGPPTVDKSDEAFSRSAASKVARIVLLDVLNHQETDVPLNPATGNCCFLYESVGEGTKKYNFAKIYSGWCPDSDLPYIVIVKSENRGKRDSIWMMMNFLNKVWNPNDATPHIGMASRGTRSTTNARIRTRPQTALSALEQELQEVMLQRLGIEPSDIRYFTVVDSDTILAPEAPGRIIRQLEDPIASNRIAASHGAILPANDSSSFATALQAHSWHRIYRMQMALDMSLFRSVAPPHWSGAFSVYRVSFFDGAPCLIHDDVVYWFGRGAQINTMHERYLVLLAEDRYLPYIMMRVHWRRKIRFWYHSGAVAWSQLCTTFSTFFRQYRRWHNCKFHLLIEMSFGAKFFSGYRYIKLNAFLSIVSMLFYPAACIQLYFQLLKIVLTASGNRSFFDFYRWHTQPVLEMIPVEKYTLLELGRASHRHPLLQSSVIAVIIVFGASLFQPLILVAKREVSKIPFYFLYLLFNPLYYCILPIYSFCTMDRVLWTETVSNRPSNLFFNDKENKVTRAHGAVADDGGAEIMDLSEFQITEVQPAMLRGPAGEVVPSFEITFSRGNSGRSSVTARRNNLQHPVLSFQASRPDSMSPRFSVIQPVVPPDAVSSDISIKKEDEKMEPNYSKELPMIPTSRTSDDLDESFVKVALNRMSRRNDLEQLVRQRQMISQNSSLSQLLEEPEVKQSTTKDDRLDFSDINDINAKLTDLSRKRSADSLSSNNDQLPTCRTADFVDRRRTRNKDSRVNPKITQRANAAAWRLKLQLNDQRRSRISMENPIDRIKHFEHKRSVSSLADQPRIVSGVPSVYAPSSDSVSLSSLNYTYPGNDELIEKLLQVGEESNMATSDEEKDADDEDELTAEDICEEIYLFLEEGLEGKTWSEITRREVRDHLILAFGEEEYARWATFVEECMEDFTLEKLAIL